jgi:hypothetical protein
VRLFPQNAAQLDEVASCVVLGQAGYLSAPPGLARVAQM